MSTYRLQSSSIPFATVENVCQDFLFTPKKKLGTELEHFSMECCWRKIEVSTSTNQTKKKITNENSDKYKLPQAAIYLNLIGSRN